MEKRRKTALVFLIIGVILIISSVILLFFLRDGSYTYTAVSYVAFGIGFGLAGEAIGRLNAMRLEKTEPERMKSIKVSKNDERNIAIDEKAKAKAFSFSMYLYAVVLAVLAVMGVELKAILILVAAYLLNVIYSLFVKIKLYKEM